MNQYHFDCYDCKPTKHVQYQTAVQCVAHALLHEQTYGHGDIIEHEEVDYQNGFKPTKALEIARRLLEGEEDNHD